jgi:hypothetical protein
MPGALQGMWAASDDDVQQQLTAHDDHQTRGTTQ